jgi:hypothetical protein
LKQEALDQAFELVSIAVPDSIEDEAQANESSDTGHRSPPRAVSLFLRPTTIERFREEARKCGLTHDRMLAVLLECFTYLVERNQVKLTVRQVVTSTVGVPKLEFAPGPRISRGTGGTH